MSSVSSARLGHVTSSCVNTANETRDEDGGEGREGGRKVSDVPHGVCIVTSVVCHPNYFLFHTQEHRQNLTYTTDEHHFPSNFLPSSLFPIVTLQWGKQHCNV